MADQARAGETIHAERVCDESNQPIFHGHQAACPGCGFMVPVFMVDGLWTFVKHTNSGVVA